MRTILAIALLLLFTSLADAGLRGRRGSCGSAGCGTTVTRHYPADAPAPKDSPRNVAPSHTPTHTADAERGGRIKGWLSHLRIFHRR